MSKCIYIPPKIGGVPRQWLAAACILVATTTFPPCRLCATPATPPPQWHILLAKLGEKNTFTRLADVIISRWSATKGVRAGSGEKTQTIPVADILEAKTVGTDISAVPGWQVVLRNGGRVVGTPIKVIAGNLRLRARGLGLLSIPLTQIAALRHGSLPKINPVAAPDDTLFLTNGDKLSGAMDTLGPNNVHWSTSLGNATIPWSRVNYFVLGGPVGTIPIHGLAQRITLTNGTVLVAHNLSWKDGKVSCLGPGRLPLHFSLALLARISIHGGNAQWLTDFTAVSSRQVSYFGGDNQWPVRHNRNVLGGPLRADGRRFAHGLGVHADSTLTYLLDGKFSRLLFSPAMDQSAMPFGRAKARVLLDGKVAWRSGELRPGMAIKVVDIPVKGVHLLTLQVVNTNRFGVESRMDWLNAALLRK